MRRKRLNHAAQQLGQMFCGWQLHPDKPRLEQLGSGTIEIDALSGQARFKGSSIASLAIAATLKQWLLEDLGRNGIPIEALQEARLTVSIDMATVPWQERSTNEVWFGRS